MAYPKYNPAGGFLNIKAGLAKHYAGKTFKYPRPGYPMASSSPSASASPSPEPEPEFESGIYICKQNTSIGKDILKGLSYEIEKIPEKWVDGLYRKRYYKIKKIIVGDKPNETIKIADGFIIEQYFTKFC